MVAAVGVDDVVDDAVESVERVRDAGRNAFAGFLPRDRALGISGTRRYLAADSTSKVQFAGRFRNSIDERADAIGHLAEASKIAQGRDEKLRLQFLT